MNFSALIPTVLATFCFTTVADAKAAETGPPNVVVSIKPVHSLVAGVMAGVGQPRLLLQGGAPPHNFSLKPSEARALWKADLIVWVGPGLENFLVKPLKALPVTTRVVELSKSKGLVLHAAREGGTWQRHGHEHGGGADPGTTDMHIWLDPLNARAWVGALVEILVEENPANAAAYRINGEKLSNQLIDLDVKLRRLLNADAKTPFLAFHDAYQYFEKHYGLHGLGSVMDSPRRWPGTGRLSETRAGLRSQKAVCLFFDTPSEPPLVRPLVEGTGVRAVALDPLAARIEAGPGLYFLLLEGFAESILDCLSPAPARDRSKGKENHPVNQQKNKNKE